MPISEHAEERNNPGDPKCALTERQKPKTPSSNFIVEAIGAAVNLGK
jgi:hypothetical protein